MLWILQADTISAIIRILKPKYLIRHVPKDSCNPDHSSQEVEPTTQWTISQIKENMFFPKTYQTEKEDSCLDEDNPLPTFKPKDPKPQDLEHIAYPLTSATTTKPPKNSAPPAKPISESQNEQEEPALPPTAKGNDKNKA